MLKRIAMAGVAAALGTGAAFGVAACGEDRGSVEIEGGTGTGGTGTGGTGTGGIGTAGTETAGTGTQGTGTAGTGTQGTSTAP